MRRRLSEDGTKKICSRCGLEKPRAEYPRKGAEGTPLSPLCRPCEYRRRVIAAFVRRVRERGIEWGYADVERATRLAEDKRAAVLRLHTTMEEGKYENPHSKD